MRITTKESSLRAKWTTKARKPAQSSDGFSNL
jgi:hypothetical protein